ncbi:MAG: hypothetical protein ACNA8W_01645 [Bradymonadaceae bacterium]
MVADASIEILREGRSVAHGEFVLDQAQAREKLQEFQLANPHHYVLEFVKTAHLLGAKSIEFAIDSQGVEMTFDGAALTRSELDNLFSAPFSQRSELRQQALRHLAMGVNAVLGLGFREIVIECGGESPFAIRVVGEGVEVIAPGPGAFSGTRIYLRQRAHLGRLLRFVVSSANEPPEVEILHERCSFAESIIWVNGERVSRGHALSAGVVAPMEFSTAGAWGRIGLDLKSSVLMTHILHRGVLIMSRPLVGRFAGGEAVVDSARLTMNLSQSVFVENDAWRELTEVILVDATLSALTGHLKNQTTRLSWYRPRVTSLVLNVLEKLSVEDRRREASGTFLRFVEGLPLFVIASQDKHQIPEYISLVRARQIGEEDGRSRLGFSRRRLTPRSRDRRGRQIFVLPPTQETPEQCLGHFADEVVDQSGDLARFCEIETNMRRWESSPRSTGPSSKEFPYQKRASPGSWTVVAAFSPHKAENLEIHYIKDGRLLQLVSVARPRISGAVYLEINGDLAAAELFDGPEENDDLEQARYLAIELLAEVLDESVPGWKEFDRDAIFRAVFGCFFPSVKVYVGREREAVSSMDSSGPEASEYFEYVVEDRTDTFFEAARASKLEDGRAQDFLRSTHQPFRGEDWIEMSPLGSTFASRAFASSARLSAEAADALEVSSPEPDLDEIVVRRIRIQVLEHGRGHSFLGFMSLDHLRIVRQGGRVLADVRQGAIDLDADHPIVAQALERPDDPVARGFVSAALFAELARGYPKRLSPTIESDFLLGLIESLIDSISM